MQTDFIKMAHDDEVMLNLGNGIAIMQDVCHGVADQCGWWHDLDTGEPLERNKGELFMLMVTELAEGYEGVRKGLMDDHLPDRPAEEVEIADLLIRALDYAGKHKLDVAGAMIDKLRYNTNRADHKPENRRKAGGKKT